MTIQRFGPSLAVTILFSALPAAAQDLSPSIQSSAACAPVGSARSSDAPVVLALGEARMLYYAGDRVTVTAGSEQGLENGQRFFVRRPLVIEGTPRGEHTAGWLRIVETRQSSATAVVDFSCDAIAIGDHLEPFGDQSLPSDIDRTDATGTLDFSKSATVLFGNDGRQMAGGRDFVLAAIGRKNGVTPGTRYAIYHGLMANHEPNVSFGEAVVVHVAGDRSLLRITDARDAVRSGDTLVLRVGVVGLNDSGFDLQQALLTGGEGGEGEGSASAPRSAETPDVLHSVSFDDVQFDFDKYSLRPETFALLDQATQVLQQNPALKIRIEGYSCNIGTAKYNLALGKRRANAVREYLVRHGVDAKRLTMVSFGESQPKYDNRKKETRRLNRRAALVVNIER
jgi:outer membrane protein OmpA-like peptidoglycan-associated protein